MTVINQFSQNGGLKGGASDVLVSYFDVAIAGTEQIGDVIKLAPFAGTHVPVEVTVYTPTTALTGLTSVDVGFYKSANQEDVVIDDDIFAAAIDLSGSAATVNGLVLTPELRNKDIATLCAVSMGKVGEFDLALTLNAAPSVAGTLKVKVMYYKNA